MMVMRCRQLTVLEQKMNSDVTMILQIVRQSKLQQLTAVTSASAAPPAAAAAAAFSCHPPARSQTLVSSQVPPPPHLIQSALV